MRRAILKATLVAAVITAAAWSTGVGAAQPPPSTIVTGLDAGWPDVRGWDASGVTARQWADWGEWPLAFSPYPTYQNGVRVAVGDVNGDGRAEIVTAPGGSAFTELKVFDGRTYRELTTLLPFKDASWWAGAYVATGDTNGDGRAEIVEGLDAGCCTTLHVLDALSGDDLAGFFPYGNRAESGARVAAGDVNGDGKAEILAVPKGSEQVSLFGATGGSSFRSLEVFGSEARGGASIAAGNVLGDANAELVAAVPTYAGAQVKVIDVASGVTRASYFPYGSSFVSSVEVALGDVDGDGHLDIVLCAETAGGTEVKAIDVAGRRLPDLYVLDPSIVPRSSLAAGDLDGDGKAEIVLGGGPTTAPWPPVTNGPEQRVAVFKSNGTEVGSFAAYPGLFQGGVRVALADLDGDRRPEIVTAPGPGMEPEVAAFSQHWVNGRDRGTRLLHFLAYEPSFRGGVTVATGDVDGDGTPEVVVAPGRGDAPDVRVFDSRGRAVTSFPAFAPDYTGGLSVATGDLNGDGRAEIVVGTLTPPARIRAFTGANPYGPVISPFPPDGPGVVVGVADIAGDGGGLIVAGSVTGTNPTLALIDPLSGTVVRSVHLGESLQRGIRVAGGDLDGDGRDEIVIAPGFAGDSRVRVFNRALAEVSSFLAYDWSGAGMNVTVATRIGLPIAAERRTVRLIARKRARVVVARFRDAAGAFAPARLQADVEWGDGTSWTGALLPRGGGIYDVRSTKRYAGRGRYAVTVTVSDDRGRTSTARSLAIVSRGR
jgi:FG-GAP-like repeat/FG-GAP repeat